jgi:hypothetical protein
MPVPAVETWVLTFLLTFPDSFIGGEYQTRARCEHAAVHQFQQWKIIYGPQLRYRCEVRKIDTGAPAALLTARFGGSK